MEIHKFFGTAWIKKYLSFSQLIVTKGTVALEVDLPKLKVYKVERSISLSLKFIK